MADTTTPTPNREVPANRNRAPQPWVQAALRHDARKLGRNIVLVLLGLALIVIAVLLYRHFAAWESTDDAQIDGYIYPVSSRVTGYVTRVTVDDNQYVKAGTVLVRLDPKDYEVALANANATLANDQASAAALQDQCSPHFRKHVESNSPALRPTWRTSKPGWLPPSDSLTPHRPRSSRRKPMT